MVHHQFTTNMRLLPITLFALLLLACSACKNDDNGGSNTDTCIQGFDQKAMFENFADNLIRPAYTDLQSKVNTLDNAGQLFLADPTESTLADFQAAIAAAYLSWQAASSYEFGPAAEVFLRNSLNNFPVNVSLLENNISNQNWNFDQPDDYDKGFPALDYLLFGIADSPAGFITLYKDANDADSHRTYVAALLADIKTRVDKTADAWATYRETFVNNVGTADGTALGQIINNLNHNYELFKREKIGFPSGALTSGFTNPEAVEAYYSGQSLALAEAGMNAIEDLYLGGSGSGLDDYLNQVNAEKNGTPLDELIKTQFAQIQTALNGLSDPLSTNITEDQTAVSNAYDLVSDQVVHLKTDLPSILCVSITYIDNPSDSD